jgi:hypothetical protein
VCVLQGKRARDKLEAFVLGTFSLLYFHRQQRRLEKRMLGREE